MTSGRGRLRGDGLTLLIYSAFLLAVFAAPLGVLAVRSFTDSGGAFSLANYQAYLTSPALLASLRNTLLLGAGVVSLTLPLAFLFAYGLERTRMPLRRTLGLIGAAPLLAPSLLPAMALIYLFGEQGIATGRLGGHWLYGAPGLILAETIAAFPHALIILRTTLQAADGRHYEQASLLGASRRRVFLAVTLPGARHGLISAAFVVFSLSIADVGAPKVVGGDFEVLALDIYKQVLGLQNFNLGAVVAMLLLVPTVIAVTLERWAARRQAALRSSRSTPYAPDRNLARDAAVFAGCASVALAIIGVLLVCQLAAVVKLWPYNLAWTLDHYDFHNMDGGGWDAVRNSVLVATLSALLGALVVFGGAYAAERMRAAPGGRALYSALAIAPAAAPGLTLGLAYVLFFNDPTNPLHFIYGTLWILVLANIVHFFTAPHLTAVSTIRSLDPDFESAAKMSGRGLFAVFSRVAAPLCATSLAEIALYLFANAMTTVSVVVFLYPAGFQLAAVAVLNMDDAGDTAPAAAMGMMIVYVNLLAQLAGELVLRRLRAGPTPAPAMTTIAAV